jgi:hypothetical protein
MVSFSRSSGTAGVVTSFASELQYWRTMRRAGPLAVHAGGAMRFTTQSSRDPALKHREAKAALFLAAEYPVYPRLSVIGTSGMSYARDVQQSITRFETFTIVGLTWWIL